MEDGARLIVRQRRFEIPFVEVRGEGFHRFGGSGMGGHRVLLSS